MGLTAVFTGHPSSQCSLGVPSSAGSTHSAHRGDPGPRLLLLGGRSWHVTYIDWTRRRCFVEPAEGGGRARWMGTGWAGLGYELTRAMRDVLLGD